MEIKMEISMIIADLFFGLSLRLLFCVIMEKFFSITIFHKGIPILGPVAFLAFPTSLSTFMNFGFYLIDFVATFKLGARYVDTN